MDPECDHGSNPASCPVCLGPLPAPPVRGAAGAGSGSSRPLHVVVKWEPNGEVDPLARHRALADEHGSTWWGCATEGTGHKPAQKRLEQVVQQVKGSTATHAYLYPRLDDPDVAEVWRADVVGAATDESDVDPARRPDGDAGVACLLYLELSGFERVEDGWVTERLNLYAPPDGRNLDAAGLGNRTSPLFVSEA